ncbi:MAG: serine/threonine-protein kinase [Thermoanaerobaculia bacterium]|nr:serine/threonine-protein kinase [Thermoanaerobaculia bacterium]
MIGQRLGPYEITAKLGEGGMGEVYRATDTKLRREVAIKVLPAAFTADKERLARFEREAQLLAQLHHPNIASIFGLEESDGVKALVMELVDGPTLAERLESGPLSFTESLSFALQIAQALEEAHEKGIVHRDLKPQNVKASSEGKAKVLDFGLAKAMESSAGGSSAADLARSPTLMQSPTLTAAHGTQLGVILGTAAYMAPEQARGLTVDKRADIWAFGVVLFEMLTGKRLFDGETVSDTLAAVLRQEIDWTALPEATPPAIRRLLRRCLARSPKNRLRDIGDARLVLDEVASGRAEENVVVGSVSGASEARPAPMMRQWRWLAPLLLLGAGLGAVTTSLLLRSPQAEIKREVRFQLTPPSELSPTRRGSGFELSPDGRFLVMSNATGIWVRALDAVESHPIARVEGPTYPFWSPDGAWIGFFAEGQLRKIPREGGAAQKICDAVEGRGGSWSPDGVIVFSQKQGVEGLSRVAAQGGTPAPLTRPASGEVQEYHRYPQFLPDGRSFLFQVLTASAERAGVYVGSVDGAEPQRVLDGSDQARFAPATLSGIDDSAGSDASAGSGYLLFRRGTVLMAQAFDSVRRKLSGEAIPVADGVGIAMNTGTGAFTLASHEILAFSNSGDDVVEIVWMNRAGERLAVVNPDIRALQGLGLARGEKRVAYGSGDPSDIWVQNLPSGEPSRFTFGPAPGWANPLWSPDGDELVYTTWDLSGLPQYEMRRRRADRSRAEETLLQSKSALYSWDFSPDGRSLLFGSNTYASWLLPLAGDKKPVEFLPPGGAQQYFQFSPDGRWVAYASDVQGQFEVFVTSVPPSGALWQISTGGGSMPRWRRADGRELYFRANDGTLMAVELGAGPGASAIEERSAPRPLFVGIPSSGNTPIFTYAAAGDGQRFLVAASRSSEQPPITVVLHWQLALRKRAAGRP